MTRLIWAAVILSGFAAVACGGDGSSSELMSQTPSVGSPTPTAMRSQTPDVTASPMTDGTQVPPPGVTASPTTDGTQVPPIPSPTPAPATPTPVPPTGSGGATGLAEETRCSRSKPGTVDALLTWAPASPPGSNQRVDLTFFANDFRPGTYQASDPLGGSASSFEREGLASATIYRWRVVTYVGDELKASATALFETPGCGVDLVE